MPKLLNPRVKTEPKHVPADKPKLITSYKQTDS